MFLLCLHREELRYNVDKGRFTQSLFKDCVTATASTGQVTSVTYAAKRSTAPTVNLG